MQIIFHPHNALMGCKNYFLELFSSLVRNQHNMILTSFAHTWSVLIPFSISCYGSVYMNHTSLKHLDNKKLGIKSYAFLRPSIILPLWKHMKLQVKHKDRFKVYEHGLRCKSPRYSNTNIRSIKSFLKRFKKN